MADTFTGSIIFTHILPGVLGFIGIILVANGIMDNNEKMTLIGVGLFALAVFLPFIILPLAFGI
ncbi:MAG: hypothetical protein ACRCVG_04260 [Methanobacteriaceae archaeon]